ncbi:SusC/RagA family TonB-linked outer membrane protein [Arenibacter sp. M-2]|uniref:SusC/RagA family TonB-linked outer membrane protein n=1 Tax=Arenibacter sp. M-2 TaxID=3053612 RepID=UPI00256FB09A|nr:SusC/RagA family TonB-linked outer membrane protein [Arenibacter sp. M-2]MDL5511201.1 SusC/RagA family TonB-linked outer membrane protein [Arenibacter sp. M-2]
MKNNLNRAGFPYGKMLFIFFMRTFIYLFCATLFALTPVDVVSQNSKIVIEKDKILSVDQVFDLIMEQTEYRFFYEEGIFKDYPKVHLRKGVIRTNKLLKESLTQGNLNITVTANDAILIKENPPKIIEEEQTEYQVSGTITDQNGQPLPGASVVEKGTNNGTQTDFDGNFILIVKEENAVLEVSYIGYETQELPLNGRSEVTIVLKEDAASLDEVVVVGYGTRAKQAVTGAVAVADLNTYNRVPVNNIIETVKGTLPGLNVAGINSAGAVADITIRGQNSIGAGNSPLIVVDGIIYNGSLGDIRPDDIENLTVLKDASAAAIYGARSANGVILIETKKGGGINGKPRFNFKLVNSVSNQLEPNPVYTDGWFQNILDIREAQGLDADPNLIRSYLTEQEQINYDATPDHQFTIPDPNDIGIRDGFLRSVDFSVSNSTEKSNYFISLGVTNQEGVVLNDDFRQYTTRINHSSNLTYWLNLSVLASASLRDFSGSEPSISAVTRLSPYASLYDENGNPIRFPQTTTSSSNPLYAIASEHSRLSNSLNGAIKLRFDVPWIKGLSYTSTYSNNFRWDKNRTFYGEFSSRGEDNDGYGDRSYSHNYYRLFDNLITFKRLFAQKHAIDLTLLHSLEQTDFENEELTASGFDNYALGSYGLSDGTVQTVSTGGGESAAIGQMARLNYTYDNKYSITGTVRRDGYSAFSENNKWGVFSSIGANWNITNENFMVDSKLFSTLSLSASYGSVGNRSIDPYATLSRVSTGKVIFADSEDYVVTQGINRLGNNSLGWEKTTGLNLGLDFGLLKNRISGRLDYYNTSTTDLIFELSLPSATGPEESSILDNIGEIKNHGFEVSLNTQNIIKPNFNWTSNLAFSLNRNKIETILGEDNDGDGVEDDIPQSSLFIGESLGTIFDTRVIGMWQEDDTDIMAGLEPGDYKIEDINGDGVITSDDDRHIIGNTNPNYRWSFTNTFNYKNFSLLMYAYSVWGGDNWYLSGSNDPHLDFGVNRTDLNHPIYDYWTPNNPNAEYPRPNYNDNAAYTSKKYYDRSFIKLQKVALSYDMSSILNPITGIEGFVLTLSADNLFVFAPHWDGLDPETQQGLTSDARPSIRNFQLSLSLNF